MGVPHRGSGSANYASTVAGIIKFGAPVQSSFLKALKVDNDMLTKMSFDFGHLLRDHDWRFVSVFEGEKTRIPYLWRGSTLVRNTRTP
jgi:hypothetical protein